MRGTPSHDREFRYGLPGLVTVAVALAAALPATAGGADLGAVPRPGIDWDPRTYECLRASGDIDVDGLLDEPDWRAVAWTAPFVDIQGPQGPSPRFLTHAKMLWNDEFLYVGAEMEEPDLWATLAERDAVIYHENDFEVFVDPDGDTHEYYELEVNALGTEWDLLLLRPYRDGGPAVDAWDIQGLKTAVSLAGTLNEPGDRDRGWTIEIAIPWSVLDDCAHRQAPPADGDRWRLNFSRVEWRIENVGGEYAKSVDPATGRTFPEDNWVWSPQGLIAMHYPEMWGFVEFSDAPAAGSAGELPPPSPPSVGERAAWALRRVYYAEREAYGSTGAFTADLGSLDLGNVSGEGFSWPPVVAVTPRGFEAWLTTDDGTRVWITQDGGVFTERTAAAD